MGHGAMDKGRVADQLGGTGEVGMNDGGTVVYTV